MDVMYEVLVGRVYIIGTVADPDAPTVITSELHAAAGQLPRILAAAGAAGRAAAAAAAAARAAEGLLAITQALVPGTIMRGASTSHSPRG